ncbi:hypothetical protein NLK94_25810, partial [Klebsiella pneumoniae]|nr:hypothetical protein [Klebsiella pneumoniae]
MIDFSNFYQLIAKSPLSHWLETLPAQVAAWQRLQPVRQRAFGDQLIEV